MCVHVKEEEEEGWGRERGSGREGGRERRGGGWEGDTQNPGDDHDESDFGIGGLCSAFALFYAMPAFLVKVPSYVQYYASYVAS